MDRPLAPTIFMLLSIGKLVAYSYDLAILGSEHDALHAAYLANSMQKKTILIATPTNEQTSPYFGYAIQWKFLYEYAYHAAHTYTQAETGTRSRTYQTALSAIKEKYHTWYNEFLHHVSTQKNITFIEDDAPHIVDKHTIALEDSTIQTEQILIATGTYPDIPLIHGIQTVPYTTYETFFSHEKVPDSIIIVGGDLHAIEAATALSALGTMVTLLIPHAVLLPTFDFELTEQVAKIFIERGIVAHCNATPFSVKYRDNMVSIIVYNKAYEAREYSAQALHIAIDNIPNSNAIHLDKLGIKLHHTAMRNSKKYERVQVKNSVSVNRFLQTTEPNIYAIGTVTGLNTINNSLLYQATVATHNMFSDTKITPHYKIFPSTLFTPYAQVASIGLSEQEAQKIFNGTIRIYYPHNYYTGDRKPFIKIICTHSGTIIGIHIIAEDAQELISHFSISDQLNTMHTHTQKSSLLSCRYYDMIYAVSVACAQDIAQRQG